MEFNLERFEHAVYTRQYEPAGQELIQLLNMLDNHYGNLASTFSAKPMAALSNGDEVDAHILTRIASAISHFFLDPNLVLSAQGQIQLLHLQRWLATIFAITPFRNADHVIRTFNSGGWDKDELQLSPDKLGKFAILAFPESEIPINLDALHAADPVLAVSLCMLWLAPRFLGAPSAHAKRELVLGWLPEKLQQIPDLGLLPSGIMHDVYMHCSYADRPDRHKIKAAIDVVVRKKMLESGLSDVPPLQPLPKKKKPTMLVVLEWFNGSHSIYRTHSTTMRAARRHFHVVAMGYASNVDGLGRDVFDEFIEITGSIIEQMAQIRDMAINKQARVFYMPSVGMFPLTVFAANLRFAPLQVMALGHPATTHSTCMDYVVVEDDYVGSEACFSEKLLRLPKDALPYVPSSALPPNLVPNLRENPEVVRVAVCATTMKLNPRFLQTLRAIVDGAKSRVHFEFLVGQATSLIHPQVNRVVKSYLGEHVNVNRHMDYPSYMEKINGCDLFVNPFPFGNTNGIIDTVTLGQVGICLSGAEVFEHIDEGLFGRLGVPSWMVTRSPEEYIAAAIRLIDNHKERIKLRKELIAKNGVEILFKGRPEIFGDRLIELVAKNDSSVSLNNLSASA